MGNLSLSHARRSHFVEQRRPIGGCVFRHADILRVRCPDSQALDHPGMPSPRWSDDQRTPFAVRMRAARTYSALSQKDAADRIGIKQGTLSELEKTATKSAHTAKAAQVYGVNAAWLQDGAGSMLSEPLKFSKHALFVAARLDEIRDPAEFDLCCTLCEAFAALAKAGQLAAVAQKLALAGPVPSPRQALPLAHKSQSDAGRRKPV